MDDLFARAECNSDKQTSARMRKQRPWLIAAAVCACFNPLLLSSHAAGQVPTTAYEQVPSDAVILRVRFEGDYLEFEALAKRLNAEVLRLDRPFLYLMGSRALLQPLRAEGFQPELVDPKDFFERLVRVEPADDETVESIQAAGGILVQREQRYAVFRLTLRELDLLDRTERELRPIREGDLVHRFVTIEAPDEATIEQVLSVGVDVFEGRDGKLFGRAFDGQIETLREHGIKVEVTNP